MKKITTSLLCLVLCTGLSQDQGIYLRAGGGYGLPMAPEVIGTKHSRTDMYQGNTSTTTNTQKNVTASYGAGMNVNIGGGFMFSKFLGVDLNVQYLKGKEYETGSTYRYSDDNYSGSDDDITKTKSQAIFIAPALIITPGVGSKVPYGRFGVIIGSPKITEEEHRYYDLDGTSEYSSKREYKKGTAFGFQGAVGMNWGLSGNIDLFTEINFISMTYYPGESEITEAISNGTDYLPDMATYLKRIEYKKTVDLTAQQDPDKPSQALRKGVPFSSLSLQVGIKFWLKPPAID